MKLHCKAPSRFRFTPGRAYDAYPGGLTPGSYYVDLRDDGGALQRFCLKPRGRVPNEHRLAELQPAFLIPAVRPEDLSTHEQVLMQIQAGGYVRPLIITGRTGEHAGKRWVTAFEKLASTEVRYIGRAADYNSLLVAGAFPEAIYVSPCRELFITADGEPSPAVLGTFDLLMDVMVFPSRLPA